MQEKLHGDWKHRHSTESSLPGDGDAGAGKPTILSIVFGSRGHVNLPLVGQELKRLIDWKLIDISSDPYCYFIGRRMFIVLPEHIHCAPHLDDPSNLRRLSDFAGYLGWKEADGAGARPFYDRPIPNEPSVDVDVPSLKGTSLEKRDWSRPGIHYHDDSDSELSCGVIIGVKIYFVFFLAVLLGFLIYVLSHA